MKKITKKSINFFQGIWHFIEKVVIIPVTKLVLKFTDKTGSYSRKVESWFSKSNTMLFVSLFLAILIFIVVDQRALSYTEKSAEIFSKVPVEVTYNEESYVVEGLPKTVDVTLIGNRSSIYFAKQSPASSVTVDLSGLKPGTHKVSIKYDQALPSLEYKVNPSVATVIIYPKVSANKRLTVDLLNEDSLDSKLSISDVNIDNDKVVVKGAEHKVSEVATVNALLDIKQLPSQEVGTITMKDIPLKAFDKNGKIVDVEVVPEKINAEVEITSPSKEVPIKVIPSGELGFGMAISSITTSESKVTIYGKEKTLANISYLPVEIDVNGLKENKTYKTELNKPVGVKSLSVNNVSINIKLDRSTDKVVDNVGIEYRNLAEGYSVQGVSESDIKVSVTVKGVKEVLDNINSDDITAYLDLKGLGAGTHEVPVMVEGKDSKVEYKAKTKKVSIKIIK